MKIAINRKEKEIKIKCVSIEEMRQILEYIKVGAAAEVGKIYGEVSIDGEEIF